MRCSRCGNELQMGDLFCGQCGLPLRIAGSRAGSYPAYGEGTSSISRADQYMSMRQSAIAAQQLYRTAPHRALRPSTQGFPSHHTYSAPSSPAAQPGSALPRQTRSVPVPARQSEVHSSMTGSLPKQTRLIPAYVPPDTPQSAAARPSEQAVRPVGSVRPVNHATAAYRTTSVAPAASSGEGHVTRSIPALQAMARQQSPSLPRTQASTQRVVEIEAAPAAVLVPDVPRTDHKQQKASSKLHSTPVIVSILLLLLVVGMIGGSIFYIAWQNINRPPRSTNDVSGYQLQTTVRVPRLPVPL